MRIGEEHGKPVDANAHSGCGRHTVGEGADIVKIDFAGHFFATAGNLLAKAAFLLLRVVQFGKGIAQLHPGNENLESFDEGRVVGPALRQGRNVCREIIKQGWLNQLWLGESFKKKAGYFTV